jgi:hypothetical protein
MGSNTSSSSSSPAPAPPPQQTQESAYPVAGAASVETKQQQKQEPSDDGTVSALQSLDRSFAPNTKSDERFPHYSRVTDPVESVNPVTGRSLYYGARPWRCDDRFQDWLQSAWALRWEKSRRAWRTLRECAGSEFGQQPTVPYETLGRQSVMYYVDRQDHGMIRDYMFEKYPFSSRDFVRVMTDDGTKMRVWRHQRELELEAKQGRVDEIVASRAMPNFKSKNLNS